MTTEPVRAAPDWLALREPADAAARSTGLVDLLRTHLPTDGLFVHDLGCGTGSMARWLAPRLAGPQRWVLHDRDAELLAHAAAHPPVPQVETRHDDITRLAADDLLGASLLTASALLDMFTGEELDRFVALCAGARCPVLITLSVVGTVEIDPPDPLDRRLTESFNAHQRRVLGDAPLLGPDAAGTAVDAFRRRGLEVHTRPSPWHFGPEQADLAVAWLDGWVGAAIEQSPEIGEEAAAYAARRRTELARGTAAVTVHHVDLLALPPGA
ncbi:methyltransferase domain-containing protein [Nocardioides terrigena]|uniref:methyltransferase domain-containing protein n=1 Tax=Nocardioides terrigena TaxID=424797 RepID=UPI000D31B656|nr:methyltransferase domain-containing protein [Nocardioides terrigena]